MLTLTAAGYSSTYAQFPVALTFRGITANAARAGFSILRFCAIFLALLSVYGLRPASGLWHRRWLAGNVCDRAAAAALGLVLAAFVVVVLSGSRATPALLQRLQHRILGRQSTVSFVYQQYGALAHSLLNGRLDLEADPPAELLALENPTTPGHGMRRRSTISTGITPSTMGATTSISALCRACCSSCPLRR